MNFLKINHEDAEKIPDNKCPTKFYTITFEGWCNLNLDENDEEFASLLIIASETVNKFIEIYKEKNKLTEPVISFNPYNRTIQVKIGTLEKE